MRDIKLANLSLLAKWRWRLLDDEPSLWKDVLKDKYGHLVSYSSGVAGEPWPSYVSRWWRDVTSLEGEGGIRWFKRELGRKVGDGYGTLFWKHAWLSSVPFMEAFPHLYSLA